MVCKTLTVGAAYVPTPNISISKLEIADTMGHPLTEPYNIIEGTRVLFQVTLVNSGDAKGCVKIHSYVDGVLIERDMGSCVDAGATLIVIAEGYNGIVGTHELCVEIVPY